MDLPQYLHHHPRYAPSSSSSDPNFPNYPHRTTNHYHHRHTPPPPPPTQPPQLRPQSPSSFKSLPPPPPPPHPQRTTFSPHPIDSDHSRTFSPRTTHRPPPLDSDRPRHRLYLESGPDYRDRSRNYSPRDYDRELHKPYRRDPDGGGSSARFRSEYEEQWDRRVDDGYRRRSSNHETTTFREVEFQDSGSGCYDESTYKELLKSGRRYEAYEIQRWGLETAQSEEDLYDPFELDEHDDEEDRIVSEKRDYYGSESGGRSSSTSRWKQIQILGTRLDI